MSIHRRKVHFYEMEVVQRSTKLGVSIYDLLIRLHNLRSDQFRETHFGALPMVQVFVQYVEPAEMELSFKMRFIKTDQYPGTYNPETGKSTDLSLGTPEDEGVVETTHCVLKDLGDRSILGIESCQLGPKINQLKFVLEVLLGSNPDYEVIHQLCLSGDVLKKLDAFEEAGSLTLKVKREQIPNVTRLSETIGLTLQQAQSIANSDWVQIILGFEMRRKIHSKGESLIATARALFGLHATDKLFDLIDKLEITAKESDDEQLRPYDLIKEQIASYIFVNKAHDKSKYFISEEVYQGIRSEYRRNFS